jgi:hypothetical protein
METIKISVTGLNPLLLSNPQTVAHDNSFKREISKITAKRKKTDDDYAKLADLEVASKLYWDDKLGVYVPARWVLASIAKHSHALVKVSKANIRGGVFVTENKLKLHYRDQKAVKEMDDIVLNGTFRHNMILPQGQVRVAKAAPIFSDWSFGCELEFDPKIIDRQDLLRVLVHSGKFGGYGDFRPTFGRAIVKEV